MHLILLISRLICETRPLGQQDKLELVMLHELYCSLKSYCDSDLHVPPHLCYGSVLRSPLFTVGLIVTSAFINSNSVASLCLVMSSSFVCILHSMPSLDGYFHTWTLSVTWQEVLQVLFLLCRLHCLNLACKIHTVQFAILKPSIISPHYNFYSMIMD